MTDNVTNIFSQGDERIKEIKQRMIESLTKVIARLESDEIEAIMVVVVDSDQNVGSMKAGYIATHGAAAMANAELDMLKRELMDQLVYRYDDVEDEEEATAELEENVPATVTALRPSGDDD